MKMQQYIKFVLSLVLILSNLNMAFSMHYCQDEIQEIKLNHLDNNNCKIADVKSCCPPVAENNHCEIPSKTSKQKDHCCKDISFSDKSSQKQLVSIQKIVPVYLTALEVVKIEIPPININVISKQHFLNFFVESNAPPNYIKNVQLTFYEA